MFLRGKYYFLNLVIYWILCPIVIQNVLTKSTKYIASKIISDYWNLN